MILRSDEEKLNLIKQFKESGLSMYQWCKNNHISNSCMHAWLKKYDNNTSLKSKTTNTKKNNSNNNEIKFVEVNNTITNIKSKDTVKTNVNEIVLHYKDFKINVSNSTNIDLLEKILNVKMQQ